MRGVGRIQILELLACHAKKKIGFILEAMKDFRGAEGHGQISVLDESLYGTEGGIDLIGARGMETN